MLIDNNIKVKKKKQIIINTILCVSIKNIKRNKTNLKDF